VQRCGRIFTRLNSAWDELYSQIREKDSSFWPEVLVSVSTSNSPRFPAFFKPQLPVGADRFKQIDDGNVAGQQGPAQKSMRYLVSRTKGLSGR
jgi:hypothetical protein